MSPLEPQELDCTLWIQLPAVSPSSALFHLISLCVPQVLPMPP